jgi:hypothetical protein
MTEKAKTILGTDEAWDTGQLGADRNHARRVPEDLARQMEESLEMQMISIRLHKSLIDSFKVLGGFHGIGYQPLMRDALTRFAASEMKSIVAGLVQSQKKPPEKPEDVPPKAAPKTRKAA